MLKSLNQAVPANGLAAATTVGVRSSANQRSKKVIGALIVVASVVFVAGAGVTYLLINQINQSQIRVANLQAEAGSSKQVTARYATTLASYNQTEGQLSFLESSVTPKEFVPTLLQELQNFAQSTDLTVQSVKPGVLASLTAKPAAPPAAAAPGNTSSAGPQLIAVKTVAPSYDTQPITLQVTGTYPRIMQFIYELPKFPKILSLQSVQLSPGSGAAPGSPQAASGGNPPISATLVLSAYVFDPTTSTQSPGAPSATAPAAATLSSIHGAQQDLVNQASGSGAVSPAPLQSPVSPQLTAGATK